MLANVDIRRDADGSWSLVVTGYDAPGAFECAIVDAQQFDVKLGTHKWIRAWVHADLGVMVARRTVQIYKDGGHAEDQGSTVPIFHVNKNKTK